MWRFELELVRSEAIPDGGEEGLLLLKIGKGCTLFLAFLVALNGISKGCTSDYSANKNPAQITEGLRRVTY